MCRLVLLFFLALVPLCVSHSETKKDDVVLSNLLNRVSLKYWGVKTPDEFVEAFAASRPSAEKEKILQILSKEKELPKLSPYERGFLVEQNDIKLYVDILRFRENIVYVNGVKINFEKGAPLDFQMELLRRKLFSDNESGKYSGLLNLLFPFAHAEGVILYDASGRPIPTRPVPVPPTPSPGALKGLILKFKGATQYAAAAIVVISVVDRFCPDCDDIIKNLGLDYVNKMTCTVITKSDYAVKELGWCRDYIKKLEDDRLREPQKYAIQGALKGPESAGLFQTTVKVCPHQDTSKEFRSKIEVITEKFNYPKKEAPKPLNETKKEAGKKKNKGVPKFQSDAPKNRVFITEAVFESEDKIKVLYIFEKDEKIATMEYTDNALTKIFIPNPNFNAKNPSLASSIVTLDPGKKVVKLNEPEALREEDMRELALALNEHVAGDLKFCTYVAQELKKGPKPAAAGLAK